MHEENPMTFGSSSARCALALVVAALASRGAFAQIDTRWPQHSLERPQPTVVDPGPFVAASRPSDAIVLFDGHDLSKWRDAKGGPAKWTVTNGYVEVKPGTGTMQTAQGFGDVQLHVEWATPTPPTGESQERGNSGVFLMGMYEVQVLDSYQNKTYADGAAAALFGQYPPLVNASRLPGQWQTYDIVFHRPRFDAAGAVTRPAHVTVIWNGVLVQDDVHLSGPTAFQTRPPYAKHADRLPLGLQDHEFPVRYRNIWIRELPETGN
jgi:hypothetical protein